MPTTRKTGYRKKKQVKERHVEGYIHDGKRRKKDHKHKSQEQGKQASKRKQTELKTWFMTAARQFFSICNTCLRVCTSGVVSVSIKYLLQTLDLPGPQDCYKWLPPYT